MQLEIAKSDHKITRRRNNRHGPELGEFLKIGRFPPIFTQWLKLAKSKLAYSWGLPRPIIKSHTKKSERDPEKIGECPKIFVFPC